MTSSMLHAIALVEAAIRTESLGQHVPAWQDQDLVTLISADDLLLLPALLTLTLRIGGQLAPDELRDFLARERTRALSQ